MTKSYSMNLKIFIFTADSSLNTSKLIKMSKALSIFLLFVALYSCRPGTSISSKDHGTQDHLIMSTLWFQSSAEMRASFYQTFHLAGILLEKHLADMPEGVIPAVVLDIDETILDNSPFQGQVILSNTPYSQEFWEEWTRLAQATPLPGALEFLQLAESLHVEIFYITNRKESERKGTVNNLIRAGFPLKSDEHLLMRTTMGSKEARRNTVEEKHRILLLIGDNLNDLAEQFEHRDQDLGFGAVDSLRHEFGNRFIILPNPMYGDWERPLYKDLTNPSERDKLYLRKKSLRGF